MVDVEHALIVLRQKRPVSELHVFVPQTQLNELAERPSILEHGEKAEDEHRFIAQRDNKNKMLLHLFE